MDLKTLEDYQKAAWLWAEQVIPSDASLIKKIGCISTQSLNVFRDLLWLTRKEPLKPDFDEGYLACPVDLWRPVLNKYYPHDLWLYSVLRMVKILSFWKPIFDDAGSDLESSHQNDPGLYKIWPKMTDAATAFNGAGFSTAEAIINGLWGFLLNTVECFCSRDRDMPDIFLVSENVMGYRNDQKNMEIWPNQHPAIELWKDATLKEAKEYFPSAKWPLADLDREYSRVSALLDNEITLALEKRSERDSGGYVGDTKRPKKKLKPLPKGFSFGKGQAFFKNRDLELPTGVEVNSVEILKKLVKSFGKVVLYKNLDKNSADTASDFLRGKIRTINLALKKHKVPCKIQSKKWVGYVLSNSRRHY